MSSLLPPKFKKLLPVGLVLSGGTALYSSGAADEYLGKPDLKDSDGVKLLQAYRKGTEPMTNPHGFGGFKFGGAKAPETVKEAAISIAKPLNAAASMAGDAFKALSGRAGAQAMDEGLAALDPAAIEKIGPQAMIALKSRAAEAQGAGKYLPHVLAGGAALGGGAAIADPLFEIAQPYIDAKGYELSRNNTNIYDRAKMDQVAAESFAKTLGSEAALGLTGLLGSGVEHAQSPGRSHYSDLFGHLVDTDPILRTSTPDQHQLLGQAYQSMQTVAPTIAADPFAAKNFLREVMVTGNGPDHATLGNLAKSEESIRGRGRR